MRRGRPTTAARDIQPAVVGELAHQLQGMIVYIHDSIEEKRISVESLKQQVDRILAVVTRAAEGDLTGRVDVEGEDAIAQLAKGVQRNHRILINGRTLRKRLNEAPEDGGFGEFVAPFPTDLLRAGGNSLEIIAAPSESDIDDFEFVNVRIHLGP